MKAQDLNEIITLDDVKLILTELGAQHILDHSEHPQKKEDLITNTICHNVSDGNMKLYYYHESKRFHCYTGCESNFDLYSLVRRNFELKGVELSFPQAFSWVCLKLGIRQSYYQKPDGFEHSQKGNSELDYMEKFKKRPEPKIEIKTHSDQIFYMFSDYHHPSFLEDNISHEAMTKFEIQFDYARHRICVPHRKHDTGEVIGLKMRSLNDWEIEAGFKYIPLKTKDVLYSYPTYANLYGYWQNKETIKRLKKVILFEAEKSVLQCESYYPDNNFALALCGSNLSSFQVKLILDLGVEEVFLALDKENTDTIDEKNIKYQEKLLRMGRQLAPYVRVFVIYDDDGILELKDSPSDHGKEVLEELMNHKREVYMKS